MKLSTRSRYGMRAMCELSSNYNAGPVSIKTISEKLEISNKYLHALLTILKSGGLVRSIWGSQGGFELSRPPAKITLHDIVTILEGPLCIVDCVNNKDSCENVKNCVTRDVWISVNRAIEKALSGITLEDLCKKRRGNKSIKK